MAKYEYFFTLLDVVKSLKTGEIYAILLSDTMEYLEVDVCFIQYLVENKVIIKNIMYDYWNGNIVGFKPKRYIKDGKKIVLYKSSNNSYLVSDGRGNLELYTLDFIFKHIEVFSNVKKVGKSITSIDGKIPNIPKGINELYKMKEFNNKVALIGSAQLKFGLDDNLNLTVLGLKSLGNTGRVIIPDLVKYIAYGAFQGEAIKTVHIGSGLKEIRECAFEGCTQLEEVTLGENIESIKHRAFKDCINLKRVCFNKKIKEIGIDAFKNTSLIELKIDGELDYIHKGAFTNCSLLKSVDLHNTKLKELVSETISSSSSRWIKLELSEFILPKTLEYIDISNFPNISTLKSMFIPNTIKKVSSFDISPDKIIYKYFKDIIADESIKTKSQQEILNDLKTILKQ